MTAFARRRLLTGALGAGGAVLAGVFLGGTAEGATVEGATVEGATVEGATPAATNKNTFGAPVHRLGTADPGVLDVDGVWYCYSTSGSSTGAIPIRRSTDGGATWSDVGRVFPIDGLPTWVTGPKRFWAPEVHAFGGGYVIYYASDGPQRWFCVGAATADHPEGPWTDLGNPLVSRPDYSVIDPSFFVDPTTGRSYLLWKNNTNALTPPRPTALVLQEVTADGLTLVGTATDLLFNTLEWEGKVVEAPSLIFHKGWYYLFYSGNNFGNASYAVGVARSRYIDRGYVKHGDPILASDDVLDGPGGQFPMPDGNNGWQMFFHARERSNPSAGRQLWWTRLKFHDDWPVVA
ncbi:family 43 glycosylhydrolase [Nonomuraea sp. K274]|uniref:Family 43 glycosylhydrolase n=1 Tax=Nonomuraea cypriaca TaxID=1187855 RepID=A0A931AHI4_9ACTN|nr:glycoside hydrolase family 43 protein [Nonomuraea cypriaca]MBF8192073.1 family 43 glycosylhydrolase [Nonomuraea cypriaca]